MTDALVPCTATCEASASWAAENAEDPAKLWRSPSVCPTSCATTSEIASHTKDAASGAGTAAKGRSGGGCDGGGGGGRDDSRERAAPDALL